MSKQTDKMIEDAIRQSQEMPQGRLQPVAPVLPPPPAVQRQMTPNQMAVGLTEQGVKVLQFTQGVETWAILLHSKELESGIVKGITGGIELAR